MTDQIFYPTVVEDAPFPGQETAQVSESTTSGGNSIPTTTGDKPVKKKVIAHETISQSLNTLSKKINGVFEFLAMGAIKIGEYLQGVSGEIKISPDGIVARNKSGVTTFAIDGDTGDATFKGTVQAADFTVVDENGLISLSAFNSDTIEKTDDQTIVGTTWVDVTGLSLTFTLERSVNFLFTATMAMEHEEADGIILGRFLLDSTAIGPTFLGGMNWLLGSYGTSFIYTVGEGTHTIKIQARGNNATPSQGYIRGTYDTACILSYITLGR